MSRQVVIFGNSDFAALVYEYFRHDAAFQVVAFTADRPYCREATFCSLPLIPFDELPDRYPPDKAEVFVAIGYSNLNKLRAQKYSAVKELGYRCPNYIHPTAIVSDKSSIGDNCFIMENVILHPFVTICNDVIIWSGTLIAHNTTVGDHCCISGNVTIAGNVHLQEYCYVGVNATLRDGITVGSACIIGAGAVLLKNAPPNGVYIAAGTERAPYASEKFARLL